MQHKTKQQRAADAVLKTFDTWLRKTKPSRRELKAAQTAFFAGLAAYAHINSSRLNKDQRAYVFGRILEKFHAK